MWRALRILSDLAVQRKISELSGQPYRVMVHDEDKVAFSWKIAVANLNQEVTEFMEESRKMNAEQ